MPQRSFLISASGVLSMFLISSPAWAQTKESTKGQPKFLVRTEKVKPEMVTEYEDLLKHELVPALKKGGLASQQAWATAALGDFYHYVFFHPINNLAIFDAPSPAEKALGKDGAYRLVAKLRRYLDSVSYKVLTHRSDLSHPEGKQEKKPNSRLAMFVEYTVEAGKITDFENLIKELVAKSSEDSNPSFQTYQHTVGGDANSFLIVVPVENFSDLETILASDHSPARLTGTGTGIVTGARTGAYRYLAELSYE